MSNKNSLKLVEGIFNVEDATDILCHLLEKKINFHQCRILSTYERYGKEDSYSKNRIEELRATHEALLEIMRTARLTGKNLQVNSEILLSMTDAPTTSQTGKQAQQASVN
ncbi:hypothetical protein [Flavilitoribacter nigricans]|uniref:Uncharacterized protein n=1 Tax=Flavilitoribacter nigricans (strain ATCC 23147 / DSM 23189 / NBRC 102662 / NCIMB 1420 / SS-2) TaxID=1122177 RepID=A0A2D0NF28_FLAN2|nr:hypothetical protein [Flavilitoribacter nigricans]PHN07008.1 hypothetical protein CRP01_08595 [Flavilitoribacter nigricans DSM 23189 = NBRC 102662]